ncbi:MAG: hypothetical protein R6U98_18415 [Pirellulaceae bacterium]
MIRFHITNETGKTISVTSDHTKKTVQIRNGKAAFVPHSSGNITVTLPGGKAWVYTNLSPQQLRETSFLEHESHSLFGYQDGYMFRGSSTAHLVLTKDGCFYVVASDVNLKETNVQSLEQPEGFPVKPGGSQGITSQSQDERETEERRDGERAGNHGEPP